MATYIVNFETFASINENKKQKYSYACAMLDFEFPEIGKIHDAIDKEDLYTGEEGDKRKFGLEKDTHVTLLYGLHPDEVEDKEVKEICTSFEYEPLVIHKLSIFENPKFDVLKFDVKSKVLHDCNKKLSKLPHTTDFPDYHPHATVAYLLPGKGKKYVKEFKGEEYEAIPKGIVYSNPDGKKSHWKIKVKEKED